ncbi:FAD-dependent thymidylate synthase [Candidatus Woesearchaeota archaeon]|nr:FAD-dependent thymidylate synthase [Candidatus Woesearchaeota archaeon]
MYSEEDKKILKSHVTNIDDDIYCITNLPPEVVAVLFAYVSRSPNTFKENLIKLIKSKDLDMGQLIATFQEQGLDYQQAKERARSFHEKWVVGYGHGSVAEHAVAYVAMENISILSTKVIEDNRLCAFTEKSTRYQVFDRNRYYKPKNLMAHPLGKVYEETCNFLFDTYCDLTPKMIEFVKKDFPKPDDWTEARYENTMKAKACDVIRYMLPISTLTNLGMTINARNAEHAIRKLLSHPLEEMQYLGQRLKEEIQKIIPTLVKYADTNSYIKETNQAMSQLTETTLAPIKAKNKPVTIVNYDPDAENKVIASILYPHSNLPYEEIIKQVGFMSKEQKDKVLDEFHQRMSKHDWPLRELEHLNYTFDILIDYGAFRDIQRHRICTQTNQDATIKHGYSMPREIIEAGFEKEYQEFM